MKIVTYLLAALLVAAIGAAAFFYVNTFQPMLADYTRMKSGMPELDKAKAELKKYKEKEARETSWIAVVIENLNAGLSDEIKADTVEVTVAGTGIVLNLSERVLYTPDSVTFGKDSTPLRLKLATLLGSKDMKGKEVMIGNTTDAVPVLGKGKKKIPPKDARSLAADRSLALVKYFEQNKVDQEMLIAAGYASKLPDTGFKIKDHKTIIVIENPLAPAAPLKQEAAQPAPPATAPKTIPLRPAQPKGQ